MATPSKTSKSTASKKSQVKVGDMRPLKDAKGGRRNVNTSSSRHGLSGAAGGNQTYGSKPGHGYNEN